MVDYLIGNEIKVRIEAHNGTVRKDIFTISISFDTPEHIKYIYTPSLSFVSLSDGKIIKSKDFTCSYTIYSMEEFKSDKNVKQPVQLEGYVHKGRRNDCFILYFNTPPPSINEHFSLTLKGLENEQGPIYFPELHFSGGMRK